MLLTITNTTCDFKFSYKLFNDVAYAPAKEIAATLGYSNTRQAILDHVDDDYKHKLKDISTSHETRLMAGSDHNMIYLSEPGLYQLIFTSHLPIAKDYAKWVFTEVLPSIRATGSYTLPNTIGNQIILRNETDLHYKVVHVLRTKFPDIIFSPGLGEYQRTKEIQHDAYKKGYQGGQPDIQITSPHKTYAGMAIEMKTPKGDGKLADNQQAYLSRLYLQGYKIVISDDYDTILLAIAEYAEGIRIQCQHCVKKYKTLAALANHHKYFHRYTKPVAISYIKTIKQSFLT